MNATFGNATVVGAAIPQNVDEFGTEAGIDLTQVGAQSSGTQTSPSIVQVRGARAALRGALQGPSVGGDDTTVLANQIRSPAVSRTLDFDQSAIAGTPGTPLQNLDDVTLGDITPPPGATTEGFSPGIQALAGFVQQAGVELDNTDVPMGAADVHGAALDAVGDPGAGAAAAVGLGGDEEAHMDDYAGAYEELGGIIGTLLAGNDDEDFDLVESDESDDEAPTTTSTGVQATPASGDIDAIRRRKAVQMLRRSPGLIKLIQAGEYKFSDFVTNGALDMAKLTAVRNDIRDRIESTEESYTLAAKAKGYTPSGAAFPIEGVNNIVAGVRKIPGSKYVIYQGPQYVNG